MYTVLESRGHVEVCVHVTSPKDLYDGIILVEVYDFSSSTYIPSNAELAGKYIVYLSSAKYLIGRLYILSSSRSSWSTRWYISHDPNDRL